MLKNSNKIKNFLDSFIGEKAKEQNILKKLKKNKKKYLKLKEKYENSTITKKELDKYYTLKEEIIKMAEKFEIGADGSLVLAKRDGESDKQKDINKKVESVETNKNFSQAQSQQQPQQPQQPQQNYQQPQQPQQPQQNYQQPQQPQQPQQNYQQPQQNYQQPQQPQQNYQQPQQPQQNYQQPQQPQQTSEHSEKFYMAYVHIQDMPELGVKIKESSVLNFEEKINKAIREEDVFVFGPYVLNAKKIIMYRYGDVEQ